ncbi:MAG TPA: metalloregulator ArsR/SmtB family transcription factor [Acidimicrobiales bacterium]|nr:metalloregulator ArsR/SmtB family transcription factor [Acidimicrobiales bacterium]
MDEIFKALADPGRRRLLDSLRTQDGQTLRSLCAEMHMARQSVSKHLAVLESAGLVVTVRRGREKLHYLNPAPINDIAERWITQYDQPRLNALADLKRALEAPMTLTATSPTDAPAFVYQTYIRTTPEQLWRALTEPSFTKRYWGDLSFETDWKRGSTMSWRIGDITVVDPEQLVIESDPYRRLAFSWHSYTPEWAAAQGLGEGLRAKLASERRSVVTFDIEKVGEAVKLTVLHDNFEAGSTAATMVRDGWPRVIAELKTLLETGDTLGVS